MVQPLCLLILSIFLYQLISKPIYMKLEFKVDDNLTHLIQGIVDIVVPLNTYDKSYMIEFGVTLAKKLI